MKKFYFVGNAHLDPVWMWRWQEGSAEAKATVRSALDRMKEYPDFKFVCSSASVYQWIEEFDPDMFEEIRERIREGRWIVVGGWFVQPDCNLPSGEGFARQSLYCQRYFYDRFGITATTGYNVDSFGHNLMLPQILRKSGMTKYIFMRPGEHEKPMPSVFLWQSPDGSTVPAYRIHDRYCQNFRDAEDLETKLDELAQVFSEHETCMMFYGVGNHGGGPTKHNIELILQNAKDHPERDTVFSTADDYFAELLQDVSRLPIHTDDLQHHASGCYSAVSAVKTGIRQAENALLAAEVYNVLAARLLNKAYATKTLAEAWKNVMFCHFHDIAGGCAIEDSYRDSDMMLAESRAIAQRLENNALQSISWAIDTRDAARGLPIVLFNANPFPVKETVQINRQSDRILDADGRPVPHQHVQSQVHVCFGRADTVFRASIPAMGYATYYIAEPSDEITFDNPVFASESTLENEHLCVKFDADTGYISSVFNKDEERELLGGKGAVPIVIDETEHDTWSHAKNFFTKRIGAFSNAQIKVIENGPVRATVKVVSRYQQSTLTQYFSLSAGDPMLNVRVNLDWHEQHKMLKLAYETSAKDAKAYYEIPFGVIERPNDGEEEPGQRWVAIANDTEGYALINNDKYSFSVENSTLLLTAIRSPLYGDHGRERNEECNYTDQGEHRFSYAFCEVKKGAWTPLIQRARHFNTPATVILENNHQGHLPAQLCGIACSAQNVQISTLKRAEDGLGTVLRLYEAEGKETECTVSGALLPCALSARLTPWSVNTYYLPDGGNEWKEVLLTEFEK